MLTDYHINIFFSDEDGCYVADLPDFEYCSAFGATPEEALAELRIAKEAWLEAAREKGARSRRRGIDRCSISPCDGRVGRTVGGFNPGGVGLRRGRGRGCFSRSTAPL